MSTQLPIVSCIIPVHNGAAFISQAVESVLIQEGAELEIIVVDDGSTDGSGEVASTFPGVKVHRKLQGGVAAARNDGLTLARGDFIAFLDADDLWLPGKLAAQLETMRRNPDADYSITLVRHVTTGPDGRLPEDGGLGSGEEKLGLLMQCMLARRGVFDQVGPFDTRTKTRADQDWFVRAGEAGLQRVVVDEVLTIRRIHGGNHSLRNSQRVLDDFLSIAKRSLDRKRDKGIHIVDSPVPAFEEAASRCTPQELCVRIGPLAILIRVAGPKLAERLFAPMRHIAVAAGVPPDLTICAWSVAETGVEAPVGVAWTYNEPLEWIRPGGDLIVSCFPKAEELLRVSVARPFQWSLVSVLSRRGLPALHGALLSPPASGGPGLLLVGPNGSGKSTTCLSAIRAGFQLVGEDCLVVENTSDGLVGHSLYCSCNLTLRTRELFPDLPGPAMLPYGADADAKSIMLLPPDGPASPMRRSMPVGALVFTVITGKHGPSRFVPMSGEEASERFIAALRQAKKLPDVHRQAHQAAALPLVAQLPAYRLDLGTDMNLIPPCLDELSRSLQ